MAAIIASAIIQKQHGKYLIIQDLRTKTGKLVNLFRLLTGHL